MQNYKKLVYKKLEEINGIDVRTRVKNKHKKIQEQRVSENKKPYAENTLKVKYNAMSVIKE